MRSLFTRATALVVVLALAFVGAGSTAVLAQSETSLTIVNQTGYKVKLEFVSPSGTHEPNVSLAVGATGSISYSGPYTISILVYVTATSPVIITKVTKISPLHPQTGTIESDGGTGWRLVGVR